MPIYMNDKGFLDSEGLLDQEFQFHESVSLSDEFRLNEIKPGTTRMGKLLIAHQFGSCIPVIARLSNGKYALYHAITADIEADGFKSFVAATKGEAKYIFVFQKYLQPPQHLKNIHKAAVLAIELTKALNIEVQRLHVDDYHCLVADAKSNKVILAKDLTKHSKKKPLETPTEGTPIDTSSPITIQQSVMDVLELQKQGFVTFVLIPEHMIDSKK